MTSQTTAGTRHDPTNVLIIGAGASGATGATQLRLAGVAPSCVRRPIRADTSAPRRGSRQDLAIS